MLDFIRKHKKKDQGNGLEITRLGEIVQKINSNSSLGLKIFSYIRENDAIKFTATETLENAFVEEYLYLCPQYRQGKIVAYEASMKTSLDAMGRSFNCQSDIINSSILNAFIQTLNQLQDADEKIKDACFLLAKINKLPIKYEDQRARVICSAILNQAKIIEDEL